MKNKWDHKHLLFMNDDTGILQHSSYGVPDPRHGYTTDDNARAILLVLWLMKEYPNQNYEKLLYRYASFLLHAQSENGNFRNFMSYGRKWLEAEGSEDCQGRCIWALSTAIMDPLVPDSIKAVFLDMLKKALPQIQKLTFLRAKAYALIGLAKLKDFSMRKTARDLSKELLDSFTLAKEDEWQWFEPELTYSNSILSWSLFEAYRVTHQAVFLESAESSLNFLIEKTFTKTYFQPIGCQGWLKRGDLRAAKFDQQPIEACEMLLTLKRAFEITNKEFYLKRARQCYLWYEGENSENSCLIDPVTGGCFDGVTEKGINRNMGAESQISYGISYFVIKNLDDTACAEEEN